MIDKINQRINNSEISARKTGTIKTPENSGAVRQANKPEVNVSKQSGTVASNMPRSAASLSVALGLPQDRLSSAIISFARFFSLPLKPQLLANLRRYALAPPSKNVNQSPAAEAAKANAAAAKTVLANANTAEVTNASLSAEKTRQAVSLSAAAAESKGVELTQEGLESYTEAVDPESRRQGDDRQRRRRNREQDDNAEKKSLKTEAVKKSQYNESSSPQPFTADSLKNLFLENAEQNPLLEILNRLPCKNGQRWIVLPFDFIEDNKKFSVSMRVLLDDEHSIDRAVCMALDIFESGNVEPVPEHDGTKEQLSGEAASERRWLFVMESVNEKPLRVSVYLQGELLKKSHARFKSELSNLFKMPAEHINIVNRTEPFPYEASFTENFSLIDEAV